MTEYSNLIQRLVKTIFQIKYHAENLINIYITQSSALYINPAWFFSILLLLIWYLWKRICITLMHANISCSVKCPWNRFKVEAVLTQFSETYTTGNDLFYVCPSEIPFDTESFNYLIFPQLFTKNKLLCNISQ